MSLALLPALLALAFQAVPTQTPPLSSSDWSWRVAPYLFAANLDGTVDVGGTELSSDASFSDIADHLDFGAMLYVDGHRGQWGFGVDSCYIDLGEDGHGPAGVQREIDLKLTMVEVAGLYRLALDSPYEVALGLRYTDTRQEVEVGGVSSDDDTQVLDAFFGGRALWPLGERWRFALYADVGTGDSDFTWQGIANLGYDLGDWGLNLGYRALGYEFEQGDSELDLVEEGLVLGLEYRF